MTPHQPAVTGVGERASPYLHDWKDSGKEGMLVDFGIAADALAGAEVLVASYTYEDYSGSAYVLFRRDGKLFEVHGGHCSCYGLEEQWEPEETTTEAIQHRLDEGHWGYDADVRDYVQAALAGAKP